MGEVISFEERRKNFMKGIQLTDKDRVSYIGNRTRFVRDTEKTRANHRALERASETYFSLSPEERLEIQRRDMETKERRKGTRVTGARSSGSYKGSKKGLRNALLVGGLGIALALGAYAVNYSNSKATETQDRVPLEQVIGNQDELARLGISNETATEIQNLYSELNNGDLENLSEEEAISLGSRVENIQLTTMKEKIANEMGVPVESVELRVSYSTSESPQASVVIDDKLYNEGDFLDYNDNISGEMADYIKQIAGTQSTNSRLEEGSITKQDALEQYRGAIESVRDVSTKELSIDENGNMSLSQVSIEDIDKAMEDEEER